MSGRNAQVSRIYAILNMLENSRMGMTVSEITDKVNDAGHTASKRTVYRDLEALEAAGFPLTSKDKSDKQDAERWVLEKVAKVNEHFILTSRELIALFMAKGVLTPLKDTPFFHDLDSIFKKIELRLGSKHKDHFTEIAADFHFEPGPRWGLGINPETLDTVQSSCSEKQKLSVDYNSANSNSKSKRILGPHFLYFAKGSLYLVAEDFKDNKVKVFSVARMENAQMTDDAYEGETVDPEIYFQASFGIYRGETSTKIKLAFLPTVAPYVRERRWHSSQSVVAKADGSIVLTIDAALTPELEQWVLGFGPDVRVIEPNELALKITKRAEEILNTYRTKKVAA